MNAFIAHLKASPLTTLAGFAGFAALLNQAIKFDIAGHLSMTPRDWFQAAIAVFVGVIGIVMKDAGTMPAVTPDGTPVTAKSHETLDDPANKPA